MSFTRRRMLKGLCSLVLVPACRDKPGGDTGGGGATAEPAPDRPAEPDPWDAPGAWDSDAFPWGVQVGDATDSGALVSVHTAETGLTLVVMVAAGDGWEEVARGDGFEYGETGATIELGHLEPDTAYCLAAYADDDRRTPVARFRTALDASGWRKLSIAATSCFGGNEPWPSLSHTAALDVDCLLLLGDLVYADGAASLDEYRSFYEAELGSAGFVDICASTSVVGTWDDHEVVNDFAGTTNVDDGQIRAALQAWREAVPAREGGGTYGLWRVLHWGKVADIVVLDCRSERTETDYLGAEQLQWLKDTLQASTARFKIILNSVPITDMSAMFGDAMADDRWQGFPEQRDEILSYIVDQGIQGVLWVTGDFHMSGAFHVDPSGGVGEGAWEVMAGCAGSTLNITANLFTGDEQYPLMFAYWNTCVLDLDPGTGDVAVRWIGDDGEDIATYGIRL